MIPLRDLIARHAQDGRVDWIGVRPARHGDMQEVRAVDVTTAGLSGDHARPGKRAITLIQAEHLPVISALAGLEAVEPSTLRRNILISHINLSAMRGALIEIGTARLRITTVCAPCSRMEKALGFGGYTAMRGHGGWCAEVVATGHIAIGAPVRVLEASSVSSPDGLTRR